METLISGSLDACIDLNLHHRGGVRTGPPIRTDVHISLRPNAVRTVRAVRAGHYNGRYLPQTKMSLK